MSKRSTAFSYIRFSTPEQASGDSLRRQLGATADWCKRNGVTLDTKTRLHDLGVSAFTGIHRDNADKYALASFLELVRNGKIAADSFLIVENLDRLTREHVRAAVMLFLSILEHKINLVTTNPEKVYRHDSKEMIDIIIAVVELSRGHGESLRKSEVVGAAWKEKKSDAIKEKKALSAMCPHWLRVVGGKYVEIPVRVKLVRRIFRETRNGLGIGSLCRKLNLEGVKPFREHRRASDKDKPHQWQKSSLARLLSNRAVMGEYQPHVGSKKRRPVGDPVPNFYPVIITESDYFAAESARQSRKGVTVKERGAGRNLFTGLVKTAGGVPFVYHNKGAGNLAVLARSDGLIGGHAYVGVYYDAFERVVLDNLREVSPAELLPAADQRDDAERVTALQGELAAVRARKAELVAKMSDPRFAGLDGLLVALGTLEAEEKRLIGEYQEARQLLSTPLVEGVVEAQSLIELALTGGDDVRRRLRGKLAAVVDVIRVGVKKIGLWRGVMVVIKFRDCDYNRQFMFAHRPGRRGRGYETPERIVRVPASDYPAGFDWIADELPDFLCEILKRFIAYDDAEQAKLKVV